MITNKSTEASARKWAEANAPECVEYTVRQLLCFLAECTMQEGAIWLHRGWSKIWERIEENLEDEERPVTNTSLHDPPERTPAGNKVQG